jgi:hypothetical protein
MRASFAFLENGAIGGQRLIKIRSWGNVGYERYTGLDCGLRGYVANSGLERTGTAMKEMVHIRIVEDGMKGERINL